MRKLLRNDCTCVMTFNDISIFPGQIYEIPHGEIQDFVNDPILLNAIQNGGIKVGWWDNSFYSDPIEGELYLRNTFNDLIYVSDGTSVVEFTPAIVQDSPTGIKGDNIFINIETMQRELYNDPDSLFYIPGFQPMLGDEGTQEERDIRILNLETIHNKGGWHEQEVRKALYQKPLNLLIYYGWINSFNYGSNNWNNELVAQEISKYNLIVFGDGIQDPTHGDYSNSSIIIARIKELNPNTKIFGYISVNQSLANFKTKVTQWDDLEVHGIFMDEAGYDYGSVATNGRDAFNNKVDFVHNDTTSNTMVCFVNSWNIDNIIGTKNDSSYPNTTWNTNLVASNLTINDWYLLESHAVNTAAYTSDDGYETKANWSSRGSKAISSRYTYGINLAAVSIIEDGSSDQDQFNFMYTSAIMWSLDACGSSDLYYGSSSATVSFRTRPDVTNMGPLWTLSPTVEVDNGDSDVYYRYTESGKLKLDFSSSAQDSDITKW